jgi:flavin reductase (DIM6/NTAB) family NADH-FMN oxidoreductase RutF
MSESDLHKTLAGALGRVPSGLFVLTARHGQDETGMLASWVQQCSFEPPAITAAIRKDRDILSWLTEGAAFTVNILEEDQTDFLVHFGKGFALGEPAFTGLAVERPAGAAPVLCDALAYLACRVQERLSAGDHELVIGTVVGGRVLEEGKPMVHVRKNGLRY